MIKDVGEAIYRTSAWINDRRVESRANALVIGISGGVDSAVVAGLCVESAKLARDPISVVGVVMPCHSSPDPIVRADQVIRAFGLKAHLVDLGVAFESISSQVSIGLPKERATIASGVWASGALRSCLRAPTLDYVAKIYGGIIVGTGNRDEDEVTRYFQKRGDGSVDISPIAKFHKSEVYQLAEALRVPESVIVAKPSADLWGPDAGQEDEKELGMTYSEIEWAMQIAQRYGGANGDVSSRDLCRAIEGAPRAGVPLTDRQVTVLERLAVLEETSRHKVNPGLPFFDARIELGLDLETASV